MYDVDLHEAWCDANEPPDLPAMPPIYEAAIAIAREEIAGLTDRLIDRTGVRYTRSLAALAHYHELVAWCYRRLHAERCATLQHCEPAPVPVDDGLGAIDVDDIPF